MPVVANSDDIFELVGRDAEVAIVLSELGVTEGPTWNHERQSFLFTDLTSDVIREWTSEGGVTEIRRPCNMSNGMTYDAEGRLIVCEHNTSRVTRTEHDGTIQVIASHYGDKELNSPNDVVVKSDGSVYFTDPTFGRTADWGIEREQELDFQGVFRVRPGGGELDLILDDFAAPNGLCFSPDEALLYVNDTARMHIRVFDVEPDGLVGNGRMFFEMPGSGRLEDGLPDGLKTDERGNVYCSGPGGIWIISAAGDYLGKIETPLRVVNFLFGGPEWRTIYISADTAICRVEMEVRGCPVPYVRRSSEGRP